ncbi:MAG: Hsp20/alpha crystallin family protein [Comamonadaceae bacterium]|nr:MAG: Hsp20/alpha crystallin family protein [Comamonadaceae bacterium]
MFYSLATRPSRSVAHSHAFQRQSAPVVRNSALEHFLNDTLTSLADAGASKSATVDDQEKTYTLQLDVPGLARDQLEIGIEADVVRISSREDAPRKVKAAYRFPLEIDVAGSSAKLENGVLTLTLAKQVPVSKVAQLAIQ